MKKEKAKLEDLKVKSFVTLKKKGKVIGGLGGTETCWAHVCKNT